MTKQKRSPTKKVLLHIGSPRTGTTSIQRTLYVNRKLLESRGIVYPVGINLSLGEAQHPLYFVLSGRWWSPYFYYDIFGETIQEDQFQAEYSLDFFLRDLKQVSDEAAEIILSSEGLFQLEENEIELLKHVLIDYEVYVVMYLRRQDKLLESLYRHYTMDSGARFSDEFQEFVNGPFSKHLDYYEKVEQWARYFGKDHILVFPFERNQLDNNDVVMDFLERTGVDSDGLITPEPVNTAISDGLFQVLQITNKALWIDRKDAADFLWFLKKNLRRYSKVGQLLSPEQRIAILDKYSDSNLTLAREYSPNSEGRFFMDPSPSLKDEYSPLEIISRRKISSLLEKAINEYYQKEVDYEDTLLLISSVWKASRNLLSKEAETTKKDKIEKERRRLEIKNAERMINSIQNKLGQTIAKYTSEIDELVAQHKREKQELVDIHAKEKTELIGKHEEEKINLNVQHEIYEERNRELQNKIKELSEQNYELVNKLNRSVWLLERNYITKKSLDDLAKEIRTLRMAQK